jgi:hypothetical protein
VLQVHWAAVLRPNESIDRRRDRRLPPPPIAIWCRIIGPRILLRRPEADCLTLRRQGGRDVVSRSG